MNYVAKRTLHYKSRFINKGQRIPADYPRLAEGLKHGWIVEAGGPAASPPPSIKKPIVPVEVPIAPAPDESKGPAINSLDIPTMALESLTDSGIIYVGDLIGWDADRLDALRGIGAKTAAQLLEEFDKWQSSCPDVEVDIGIGDEDGYDEDSDAGDSGYSA